MQCGCLILQSHKIKAQTCHKMAPNKALPEATTVTWPHNDKCVSTFVLFLCVYPSTVMWCLPAQLLVCFGFSRMRAECQFRGPVGAGAFHNDFSAKRHHKTLQNHVKHSLYLGNKDNHCPAHSKRDSQVQFGDESMTKKLATQQFEVLTWYGGRVV